MIIHILKSKNLPIGFVPDLNKSKYFNFPIILSKMNWRLSNELYSKRLILSSKDCLIRSFLILGSHDLT